MNHETLERELLLRKCAYYRPELLGEHVEKYTVSDADYDAMEAEYLKSCKDSGKPNLVVHQMQADADGVSGNGMMEVDETSPVVIEALASLSNSKEQTKISTQEARAREELRRLVIERDDLKRALANEPPTPDREKYLEHAFAHLSLAYDELRDWHREVRAYATELYDDNKRLRGEKE